MSSFATINFPHRGDVAATRAWLDQQGFNDKFVEWVADSLLGINYEIMSMKFSLPEEIDRLHRLWGLLETARKERAIQTSESGKKRTLSQEDEALESLDSKAQAAILRSFVPKDLFDATVEKYEKLLTAANARADQLSASLEKEVNDNKTNMKEFFLRNSAAIQAAGGQEKDQETITLQEICHGKVSVHEIDDSKTHQFIRSIKDQPRTFTSVDSVERFLHEQRDGAIFKLPADFRCFRSSFKGNFLNNCVDVSLSETCIKLAKTINSAYNLNPIQSNVSEMQMISVIDACLFIFNVVLAQNPQRNVSISTSGQCKPDYSIEYRGNIPLVIGEEKLRRNYAKGIYGKDPYVELLGKIPLTRWKEFFGDLPFIFGYHALGDAHSNDLTFGLIHPTTNEKGEHFSPVFVGNLFDIEDREDFCSVLFKLIPVLIYLKKQCSSQAGLGCSWNYSNRREGFCKSLQVIMMQSIPVLEIKWSSMILETLDTKMRMVQRVVDLIGSRSNINWLHFHPSHQKLEPIKNEFGFTVEYKCFMIPCGQSTVLTSGTNFKHCLQNVCDEVKWCHEHNLIHNDIRWANICTLNDVYFLIDFDDAWIMADGDLCPPLTALDPNTHFKSNEPHGFETDLWAIGNLILTAEQVGYTVTHSQRQLGIQIVQDVQGQRIKNINEVIEYINSMDEN